MIISEQQAHDIALKNLRSLEREWGYTLVLLDNETVCVEKGWIFFYNSKDFVETLDPIHALVGNGPLFVEKLGSVKLLPTAIHWTEAIKSL